MDLYGKILVPGEKIQTKIETDDDAGYVLDEIHEKIEKQQEVHQSILVEPTNEIKEVVLRLD
jgi:hypothetical protein